MLRKTAAGFTLIELLVVIAIIGILASIVAASLSGARTQSKITIAAAQIRQINTGILKLQIDTGVSVKGCPSAIDLNLTEYSLTDPQTGLSSLPTDLTAHGTCQWTAAALAKWNGPYIASPLDPWGNAYWYDPDYYPRRDNGGLCASTYNPIQRYQVIVSGGPNGLNGATTAIYDCDDIFDFLTL